MLLSACGGVDGIDGGSSGAKSAPTALNPMPTTPAEPSPTPTANTGTGSVLLTWMPPTQNTDQSPLVDLAGYQIGFGSSPDAMNNIVQLTNAGLTAFMVENLPKGTSYFVIMSVNSRGVVGPSSPVISKIVN